MKAQTQVPLEEAMKLGTRCMREGNTLVAEQTFRDILKAVPDHYQSQYFLGLCCYYNGKIEEARDAIEKALEIDDSEAQCWSNLGAMYSKLGDHKKALEIWDKAIEIDPALPDSYGNKANALWELGRPKEAEENARKAVELYYEWPDAWLNLGNALVAQGRHEEAYEAWREALKIDPKYANAYNNIGNALRDQGKLKESEENCRKAVELNDDYPHAHNNLGNALRDQGKNVEAEEHYRKAIALQPDYAEAHNNLCVCLIDQMRYDEAITSARYAVSFKPDYADAHINMCVALRFTGKVQAAEQAALKAFNLKPDSAETHIELADVYFMQDRYDDAEKLLKQAQELKVDGNRVNFKLAQVLERALRVDEALEVIDKAVAENPEMPEAYLLKGQIYHLATRLDEALAAVDQCIALRPAYGQSYITKAEILLAQGDTKKARECAEKAKSCNPNLPGVYSTLAKVKKFTKEDEDFKKLKEIEKSGKTVSLAQQATLNYALFEAHEDIKDYEGSFEYLKKANDIRRKLIPYDGLMQKAVYDQVKRRYSADYIKSFEGKGFKSDIPVFVLGMPRSGTTLTEQIIASHPQAFGAGELNETTMLERKLGEMTPENAREFGETYVQNLKKYDTTGKAKKITDKMPGNFMRLGQIACMLPEAKIIHCVRDPVDTCLSCYKQSFARGQYWSYDFDDLARQYKLYADIMEHWRQVLPGRFLEFQYEETVTNIESQARKLIDFIGLPWNDACLEPHKHKRDVLTASKTQVIQPIYTTSVRSWQRYEKQLEPLITALGYNKKTHQLEKQD